jgi:hypothetical protein
MPLVQRRTRPIGKVESGVFRILMSAILRAPLSSVVQHCPCSTASSQHHMSLWQNGGT